MKKFTKKALCVLLAALMLSSLGISAFAATEETVEQYGTYLCLGDSISAGCAVPFDYVDLDEYDASLKYWDDMYHGYDFERVPRCYHDLVATATGTKLISGGLSANRTVEMRYLLEGVYNDSDDDVLWGTMLFGANGTLENMLAILDGGEAKFESIYGVNFEEAVAASDLITINLGSNDVISYSATITLLAYASDNQNNSEIQALIDKMEESGDIFGSFTKLLEIANTAGKLNNVLKTFADCLTRSFATFRTNWKAIIKDVYELNPDTTVVAVGVYNPFNQFIVSEDISLKVGKIMDPIVAEINLYMKSFELYYSNYKHADCSKTEIYDFDMSNVSTGDYITKVHPTIEGHKYMASQILSVLPERQGLPFTDVPVDAWYYNDVYYVYKHGLMNGTSETTFSPNSTMTRGMVATVLYRINGSPAVKDMANPFKDVKPDMYYTDAVTWAYCCGVIKGYGDGTFRPNQDITRQEFAAMLYRYGCVNGNVDPDQVWPELSGYSDADSVLEYAKTAMSWAVANGIINGTSATTLSPKGNATRAQCAAMLARFDRNIVNG